MTIDANHTIKVNRAIKMSAVGAHPNSAAAMLAAIPTSAIDACPARVIAAMLDANWRLAQKSKAIAVNEIIEDGAVWDGVRSREITA